MTLLYYDPLFLEHRTGAHPEKPERLEEIARHLQAAGLDQKCERPQWKPVTLKRLAHVHSPHYAAEVEAFSKQGGGRIEADTVCSPRSYEVALQAAGAVCDAVDRVVKGPQKQALCLVRPPGHHALKDAPMGFCLFNNVAIGARIATSDHDLDRVLVIDWDVHHGNGTQDAFWEDEQVGFFSIHRWPFYPGTGRADETGAGRGLGATLNVPVEFGTSRARYHDLFADALGHLAEKIKPQLILISAGFDSHRQDPVGSLGLEVEDFAALTRTVLEVANTYAGGKIVSVLEGGYNPKILAESVGLHLKTLLEHERPEEKG